MSKFHLRLRELRQSRHLSQQALADYLKISKSSVNMYERGEREPGLDTLEAIADFFNVDIDYLTGKTSEIKVFDDWNKTHNTNKLSQASSAYSAVNAAFGGQATDALHKFVQLDETDQQRVIERMDTMLEDDKYNISKESSEKKAM